MVIRDGTGKEYHSVEIQLESVLIPKERIESKFDVIYPSSDYIFSYSVVGRWH